MRHVAATLVDRGNAIVADLGVNQGRLSIDDLDSYGQHLADLSQFGPPVLVLMDDPFFADSGWDILLERIARLSYSNIAVLGASPTYLYDTYARRIASRQIILNRFELHPTSMRERTAFARMYGIKDDAVLDSDEDLLAFVMEMTTGQPFDEIIARIWSTLNDGIPIARKSRAEDVPWPVMAFLLTCYMHRHNVMCPEPLLRSALLKLSQSTHTDYVAELSELSISQGWHIFRVSWQAPDARPTALIGTMHARVAERAWQTRPVKSIDIAEWLATTSVDVPECVPQLADFILACRSTIDREDRRFVQRVAELWDNRRVSTAQLSALVRSIRSSPQAATLFRRPLRERLQRRDSASWLAAVELINLARRGSPERSQLEQVDLLTCLKRANLAAGSEVAIETFAKHDNRSVRQTFVDTLCASLEGKLEWQLDGTLLIWLLQNYLELALQPLMPRIYKWLESHPAEVPPRVALMHWYRDRATAVGHAELQDFWDEVRQWVASLPDSTAIPLEAFSLTDAMLKANVPLPNDLFAEIFSWVHLRPDDARLRHRLLSLTVRIRDQSIVTTEVIEDTRAWLRDHPDDARVRSALLELVRVVPGSPGGEVIEDTRAWLRDHPDDARVRSALLELVRVVPGSPGGEVIEDTRAWLRDHPDDARVRSALLELVRVVPGSPGGEVIEDTRAWLRDHPDDARVRSALLELVRVVPGSPGGEVIEDTRAWLRDHPDGRGVADMTRSGGRSEWERQQAAQRREAEQRTREQARLAMELEKQRRQQHLESQQQAAETKAAAVNRQIKVLDEVLTSMLPLSPLSFERLKVARKIPNFAPGPLAIASPMPDWNDYAPIEPGGLSRMFGGAARHERRTAEARDPVRGGRVRLPATRGSTTAGPCRCEDGARTQSCKYPDEGGRAERHHR